MRDIEIGEVGAAIDIDMLYEEGERGPFTPVVRNVRVERMTVDKAEYALRVRGQAASPVRGLLVADSVFRGRPQGQPAGGPGGPGAAQRVHGAGRGQALTADLFSLEGRRALVTGASRGLGAAIAAALAEAGADVAVHGHATPTEATCARVREAGRRALALTGDLGDREVPEPPGARGRGRAGRPRHPRQQRGPDPAGPGGGDDGRGLGDGRAGGPGQRLPALPRGRAPHAGARLRQGGQHRLAAVLPGRHPRARLRRRQARAWPA